MKRFINQHLNEWLHGPNRKPLLLRGARQVGKSFAIEAFAQEQFSHWVTINFESEPEYKACFDSMKPQAIINAISAIKKAPIEPGKTLLFLDEIQAHPPAIQSLQYFKEKLPELHVIAAGSLLEFALQQESINMPVGRVEYLYLHPCSFKEFLMANHYHEMMNFLHEASLNKPLPRAIHENLLRLFRQYMVVGGMPEAVQTYADTEQWYLVHRVQNSLLNTYRDDFGKYATKAQYKYLDAIYNNAPGMIGQQIGFTKTAPEFRSRDLKNGIELLEKAHIIKRIYATSASGLPLDATINEKKFKLHFLDVGLVQRKTGLDASLLLNEDLIKLNDGALAEQVVSQELLAMQDPFAPAQLHFWARDKQSAQAKVDYVINIHGHIIPIEVKSGSTGRLKSLQVIMKEKGLKLGVKISQQPLSLGKNKNILNIPLYLTCEIERVVSECGSFLK